MGGEGIMEENMIILLTFLILTVSVLFIIRFINKK